MDRGRGLQAVKRRRGAVWPGGRLGSKGDGGGWICHPSGSNSQGRGSRGCDMMGDSHAIGKMGAPLLGDSDQRLGVVLGCQGFCKWCLSQGKKG